MMIDDLPRGLYIYVPSVKLNITTSAVVICMLKVAYSKQESWCRDRSLCGENNSLSDQERAYAAAHYRHTHMYAYCMLVTAQLRMTGWMVAEASGLTKPRSILNRFDR